MAANVAGERFVRWSGPPSLHRNIFWSYTIFKTVGCNKIDLQNNWLYIRLTSTKYICYFGKHVSFYGNWLYNGMVIFEGLSGAGLVAIYQYIDAKYHHFWDHLHHQFYQCILQHSPKWVKEGFSGRRLSLRKSNNKVESTENRIY